MRFIETAIFTRVVTDLMDDGDYQSLQAALLFRPHRGSVIPQSDGLRKTRWSRQGEGKRGGCRVIYYWHEASETFFMLYAYHKSDQEDLTARQIRVLSRPAKEEFR